MHHRLIIYITFTVFAFRKKQQGCSGCSEHVLAPGIVPNLCGKWLEIERERERERANDRESERQCLLLRQIFQYLLWILDGRIFCLYKSHNRCQICRWRWAGCGGNLTKHTTEIERWREMVETFEEKKIEKYKQFIAAVAWQSEVSFGL